MNVNYVNFKREIESGERKISLKTVGISEDGSKREDTTSESGGGGGLINNLVSTLIAPLSPSIGKATEHESGADDDGEKEGVDGCEEGGGIIRKMVSNFFHQSEGEGVVEAEEDKEEEDEIMAGGFILQKYKQGTRRKVEA